MIDTLTKAQDEFFTQVEKTNERVVSAAQNVAQNVERAGETVPERIPFVKRVNLDSVQVPEFVQDLPSPMQVADLWFDFVTRSVELNRSFTEQMISIVVDNGKSVKKAAKKAEPKKTEAKAEKPAAAKKPAAHKAASSK